MLRAGLARGQGHLSRDGMAGVWVRGQDEGCQQSHVQVHLSLI